MSSIRDDVKPAAFIGASTAVLGTVGGILPSLIHSVLNTGSPSLLLFGSDLAVVAAIGAGQGLAAAASALARGKGEHYISPARGLAGAFAVGAFNGLMYLLQMAVPATELGWTLDLLILGAVGAAAGWIAVRVPKREPAVTL